MLELRILLVGAMLKLVSPVGAMHKLILPVGAMLVHMEDLRRGAFLRIE